MYADVERMLHVLAYADVWRSIRYAICMLTYSIRRIRQHALTTAITLLLLLLYYCPCFTTVMLLDFCKSMLTYATYAIRQHTYSIAHETPLLL